MVGSGYTGKAARRLLGAVCSTVLVVGLLGAVSVTPSGARRHGLSAGVRAADLTAAVASSAGVAWPAGHRPLSTQPGIVYNPVGLGNAGYIDSSTLTVARNGFAQVSGGWTVPAVTCTVEDRLASVFVGLGGSLLGGSAEEVGTTDQCFQGTALYYSWYEMYPAKAVVIGTSVKPGDHILATVYRSGQTGTTYTMHITDSTTGGNSGSGTGVCSCGGASIEWLVDRPSLLSPLSGFGGVPLAQFAKTTLVDASGKTTTHVSGSIATFETQPGYSLLDETGSYPLATTSGLNGAGNSFSVTWGNSF